MFACSGLIDLEIFRLFGLELSLRHCILNKNKNIFYYVRLLIRIGIVGRNLRIIRILYW